MSSKSIPVPLNQFDFLTMSSIVDLQTQETNAVKLAEFLHSKANADTQTCTKECIALGEQSNFSAFVSKLSTQPELLFSSDKDSDVEGVFAWLGSVLVKNITKADEHESLTMNLCNAVVQSTDRSALRLRILTNLFNLLSRSPVRFQVFTVLLTFASTTGNVASITSYLANLEEHVKAWNPSTTVQDLQQLYLLSYKSLTDVGAEASAQNALLKYLSMFNGASASDLAGVKDLAAGALVGAIEAPLALSRSVDTTGIMSYSAVQQLKGDAKYGALFNMMEVFSNGNVVDFKSSKADGVDMSKGLENVRLLCVCSMASSTRELTYSEIALALEIEEKDVEEWVVKAVTAELLEAQIDQLRKVIVVERAAPRFFNDQHWKNLNTKLHGWRDNVKELLAVVRSAKAERANIAVKRGAAKKA